MLAGREAGEAGQGLADDLALRVQAVGLAVGDLDVHRDLGPVPRAPAGRSRQLKHRSETRQEIVTVPFSWLVSSVCGIGKSGYPSGNIV